jgi:hypothetical protein
VFRDSTPIWVFILDSFADCRFREAPWKAEGVGAVSCARR